MTQVIEIAGQKATLFSFRALRMPGKAYTELPDGSSA
jgi:hypothetical protein